MPFRLLLTVLLGALAGCSNPSRPPAPIASTSAPVAALPPAPVTPGGGGGRDAYVLLSGGGTPLSNHYSQYVQAKALAAWFEEVAPADSRWVFFGMGNRPGRPVELADVRRDHKRDGLVVSSWLPGVLPDNRPATRAGFLRALREEILPAVRGGGTLFLFVGDHGELSGKDAQRESAITLWQLKRSRRGAGSWTTDGKEVLGVAELRQILTDGLGAGRVVFCMTQCHGGGFHELGVPREIEPPRPWFTSAAAGRPPIAVGLRLRVAGYTATDEASPAAGCDPDPDPDGWAGYERFLPESLLGFDLLSGQPKGTAAMSFAEAHRTATLADHTIDKPRSTSEHYLATWATAIETRLGTTLQVTSAVADAVTAYRRAVETGVVTARTPAMRERQEQYRRFTAVLAQQLPDATALLERGTRRELETARASRGRTAARGPRRPPAAELRRAWSEAVRPAWKAAVLGGRVSGLQGPALEFEKQLLAAEDGGANLLLPRGGSQTNLLNEVYWKSGYASSPVRNREAAEGIARWGAARRSQVVAWARAHGDSAVRAAAEKIGPGPVVVEGGVRPMTRTTAVDRVLFYRRVLAAWDFLLSVNATGPLADLQTLIDLEQTAVPGRR